MTLLAGEERFSIAYEGKGGDVYFDMLSFSRGAPPLGGLLMPLIRPLQVSSPAVRPCHSPRLCRSCGPVLTAKCILVR